MYIGSIPKTYRTRSSYLDVQVALFLGRTTRLRRERWSSCRDMSLRVVSVLMSFKQCWCWSQTIPP